jgi:hypothetical protein
MDPGSSWTRCFRPDSVLCARRSTLLTGVRSSPAPFKSVTGESRKNMWETEVIDFPSVGVTVWL